MLEIHAVGELASQPESSRYELISQRVPGDRRGDSKVDVESGARDAATNTDCQATDEGVAEVVFSKHGRSGLDGAQLVR